MDRVQILQIHQRASVISRANIRREARCPLSLCPFLTPFELCIPLVIHLQHVSHYFTTAIILALSISVSFYLNQAISLFLFFFSILFPILWMTSSLIIDISLSLLFQRSLSNFSLLISLLIFFHDYRR